MIIVETIIKLELFDTEIQKIIDELERAPHSTFESKDYKEIVDNLKTKLKINQQEKPLQIFLKLSRYTLSPLITFISTFSLSVFNLSAI